MKVLKVSELKAGDRFSKPVYIDQENILVPPNVPLKQKEIDRLIRWGIEQVTTEGERISEGSTQGKPGATLNMANLLQSPLYQEFSKTCATLTGNIEKVQSAIKDHLPVDTTLIDKTVDSLIRVLKSIEGNLSSTFFSKIQKKVRLLRIRSIVLFSPR